MGEALARAGFRAVGPLLPGHGSRAEDLYTVTRHDLIHAAQEALLGLAGARRVFICGLSAGALLAIHLASKSWMQQGLPELSAIALMAPAIQFTGPSWLFTNVIGRLPALPFMLDKGRRDLQGAQPVDDGSYRAIPMRWGPELHALSQEALKLAHRVRAPALILHGALDGTVSPTSARKLSKQLASARIEVRILPNSGHVLPLDVESAEVCKEVVRFFQGAT